MAHWARQSIYIQIIPSPSKTQHGRLFGFISNHLRTSLHRHFFFIFDFLYSQLLVRLPYPTSDFSGQTIVVTGANSGLGLEAARHIVRLNAKRVILAVRSVAKGNNAAANISLSTDTDPSRVEVWHLDLSNFESVKNFAAQIKELDRLDAVIQNAGILTNNFVLSEGMESTVTVNVVRNLLLGLLVLPKLRESAALNDRTGRLSFVGSDLQVVAKFTEQKEPGKLLENLNSEAIANMPDRYSTSKLLQLYAVRSIAVLSPVCPKSNVVINYLTPGACYSDIFKDDAPWYSRMFMAVAKALLARTTEAGSRTLVHAARPDIDVAEHGAYLQNCSIWPNGENVDSEHGQSLEKRFVNELFGKLEEISPGVMKF
ncbi:hypothetical protein MMC13_003278 [Lambiella insularis]|nr:hypothetical protein [Lambiella insularis]